MKKDAWIVIANSSIARIFKAESIHSFVEVDTLCHTASRLKGVDLISDRPGRTKESSTTARHATEPHLSPKENEFDHFALELAQFLETGLKSNKFKSLYISASPHFLGLLKGHLKNSVSSLVEEYISKDLTALKNHEINDCFVDYLIAK